MCGIFAYLTCGVKKTRAEITSTLLTGLKRLEYRGYDSAGLAVDGELAGDPATVVRAVGSVDALVAAVKASAEPSDQTLAHHVGIAHTRWATHGEPSENNAHPHVSDEKHQFVVVHNGIVTNYRPLKAMLTNRGLSFASDTDTEVIAKFILYLYETTSEDSKPLSFPRLMMYLMNSLEGAFTLVVRSSHFPNEVAACKRGSPLVVGMRGNTMLDADIQIAPMRIDASQAQGLTKSPGMGVLRSSPLASTPTRRKLRRLDVPSRMLLPAANNRQSENGQENEIRVEYFFSSDASAIVEHTDRVIFVEDDEVVHIRDGRLDMGHVRSTQNEVMTPSSRGISKLTFELEQIMKGNYKHFMLKEIFEQPETVKQTMQGRLVPLPDESGYEVLLGGIKQRQSDFTRSSRMIFIACGTSYNSCLAGRQVMEELTEMPVSLELASDFLDRKCPIFRSDVCVFVSQSGETAETLEALRYCKSHQALTVGIVNVVGSAIARLTDCGVHLNAGCEIGVASTKVYTSQIIALILIALQLSTDSNSKAARRQQICSGLANLPAKVSQTLQHTDAQMKELASKLADNPSILLFGRGYHYATCLESALKIKEISYLHTEGIHAGELKHGPIALIDDKMPLILFIGLDANSERIRNSLHQVLARATGEEGRIVVVCVEGDHETLGVVKQASDSGRVMVLALPQTVDCMQSILHILPMQLLSYHLAVARGHNVDRPRNLAKSVTVE